MFRRICGNINHVWFTIVVAIDTYISSCFLNTSSFLDGFERGFSKMLHHKSRKACEENSDNSCSTNFAGVACPTC